MNVAAPLRGLFAVLVLPTTASLGACSSGATRLDEMTRFERCMAAVTRSGADTTSDRLRIAQFCHDVMGEEAQVTQR